jgi:polyribonucleotide nucleotidyltransferase
MLGPIAEQMEFLILSICYKMSSQFCQIVQVVQNKWFEARILSNYSGRNQKLLVAQVTQKTAKINTKKNTCINWDTIELKMLRQIPQREVLVRNSDGRRLDGRKFNEFRQIYMKTGIIEQAAGSAYLEMNNTKVIVGVYGPRQTPKMEFSEVGKLECEFKYTSFACKGLHKSYPQDKEEKENSSAMKSALEVSIILEKFPKSVIDIYALVLESGGGALSAAITCASLALADAGIG